MGAERGAGLDREGRALVLGYWFGSRTAEKIKAE